MSVEAYAAMVNAHPALTLSTLNSAVIEQAAQMGWICDNT
jgi:hypothetical protein